MEPRLSALFPAHFREIEARAQDALARVGFDAMVVHSGSHRPRSSFDDQDWPLRVVPTFLHFLPWSAPDAFLVVHQTGPSRLGYVHTESFWELSEEPDLTPFHGLLEPRRLGDREAMRALLPAGRAAFVGEDHAVAHALGFTELNPKPLVDGLEDARVSKTAFELEALREASLRAARGHRAAEQAFLAGERSELALHLEYLRASGQDAFDTPYQNIVALGDAGAILHYVSYRTTPKREAGSFLLDAGATCLGRHSDITRTHAARTDARSSEFADLVAGMERLQRELVAAIRVGDRFERLHDESHERLAELLIESELARPGVSREALVASRVTRAFYPHGLGHSLGVQVHDVACRRTPPAEWNPFLRNTSIIAPGQVFTMEPGLYFIESLLGPLRSGPHAGLVNWPKVEALSPMGGIRIEDDVAVGASGVENLTRDAFQALSP